jgi:hypothetical protein
MLRPHISLCWLNYKVKIHKKQLFIIYLPFKIRCRWLYPWPLFWSEFRHMLRLHILLYWLNYIFKIHKNSFLSYIYRLYHFKICFSMVPMAIKSPSILVRVSAHASATCFVMLAHLHDFLHIFTLLLHCTCARSYPDGPCMLPIMADMEVQVPSLCREHLCACGEYFFFDFLHMFMLLLHCACY